MTCIEDLELLYQAVRRYFRTECDAPAKHEEARAAMREAMHAVNAAIESGEDTQPAASADAKCRNDGGNCGAGGYCDDCHQPSAEPLAWRWLAPIPGGMWSEHYSGERPTPVGKKGITPLYEAPPNADAKDAALFRFIEAHARSGISWDELGDRFVVLVEGCAPVAGATFREAIAAAMQKGGAT